MAKYCYLSYLAKRHMNIRLKRIYTTAPAASKYDALFKSCQNQLKHNQLASLILIFDTVCITCIAIFMQDDQGNIKPIPNLYTLHSWMGLTTVILFTFQVINQIPFLQINAKFVMLCVVSNFQDPRRCFWNNVRVLV